MTDLEDRLRRHLKIHSERIGPESVRPLRVPPPRRRSATVRWLAPVAAVAAVIALIAGVSLAGQSAGSRPAAGTVSGMPPYYVALTGATRAQGPVLTATVRDSATGAALTAVGVPVQDPKVSLPAKHTVQHSKQSGSSPVVAAPMPSGISAAADGRTFAITDDLGFFLLRVAADGRSARLTRLPINASNMSSDDAALSPDGSQLAIDVEPCSNGGCHEAIEVVSLTTGGTKVWTVPHVAVGLNPAWVDDGQEIMFLWDNGQTPAPAARFGYRLLNAAAPGGNLIASSRPVPSPSLQNGWYVPGAVLTPDGSALITTDYRNVPGPDGRGTAYLRVVELSASTGRLLRVLHVGTEPYGGRNLALFVDEDCNVLALGPAGLHALVQCPTLGRIDGSKFTPLPGVPVAMNPATGIGGTAAW